jgi:translation initiation factor IF-1
MGHWELEARGVRRLVCPMEVPWSISGDIFEWSLEGAGETKRLRLQMSSGDVVEIEAACFLFHDDLPGSNRMREVSDGRAIHRRADLPPPRALSLISTTFDWPRGLARFLLWRDNDFLEIEAQGVRDLHCPRRTPRGEHDDVSGVAISTVDDHQRLELRMESGDVVVVEARRLLITEATNLSPGPVAEEPGG